MTKEEAIKQLKRMKMDKSHTGDEYNAIMVAIQALEQNPMEILTKHLTENNLVMCSTEFVEDAKKALEQPCVKPTTEDAIKTIQELMIACTPDSKYYRVGQMAISAMLENEELSKDLDEALKEIDGYERGLSQKPCSDAVSREAVIEWLKDKDIIKLKSQEEKARQELNELPSVTVRQTGNCKDCKWWKDSDGLYRRGGHAESQCPINRREVFEGNGYCYMFEPQERSNEE